MHHVFFAGPQELDGLAHRFGNLSRLHDEVQLQSATEATAQKGGFQCDVFGLDLQRGSHGTLSALLELGWSDQQHFVTLHMGGEVHRLQR